MSGLRAAKRDPYLDVIKGFAICSVVLGHSVQFANGHAFGVSGEFFYNGLFMFIYSWHMPLFMLVSGYLFYRTIHHYAFRELLQNRWKRLLVPLLSWWMLYEAATVAWYLYHGQSPITGGGQYAMPSHRS